MKEGLVVAYDLGKQPVRWYKNGVLIGEQLRLF